MTTKKMLSVALSLAVGLAFALAMSGRAIVAGQAGGAAVAIDNDDIGGVVTGAQRSRGRRLGHRGNQDHADALDQERGDRRSGPLRRARSAGRGLRRVGSRLRARGLAEGQSDSRARS